MFPLLAEDVNRWLFEDRRDEDITTRGLIPEGLRARARIVAKENGILCGTEAMDLFLQAMGSKDKSVIHHQDGSAVKNLDLVLEVEADYILLLEAERSFLNLLQHLSGIASLTRQFVNAVSGSRAKILDTRKTTPGLRLLEKAAVVAGGGHNHRIGLFDQFLIKENHLAFYRKESNPFLSAIEKARAYRPGTFVTIEVQNLAECRLASLARPDVILLDNMGLTDMSKAVAEAEHLSKNTELEASGGVNLEKVHAVAQTGVHRISIGALTHSAKNMDLSMLIDLLP